MISKIQLDELEILEVWDSGNFYWHHLDDQLELKGLGDIERKNYGYSKSKLDADLEKINKP